jgi:hypothetical protein
MSLPGRAFSTSAMRGATMGSNAWTDLNTGGGSKKMGLGNQVGKTMWVQTAYDSHGLTMPLYNFTLPLVSTVSQSRPIGSRPSSNYGYWNLF